METACLKAPISYVSCRFLLMASFRCINIWRTQSFIFLFFLREYYLYLNKCHQPVIECFCLSLLSWIKLSLKRPSFLGWLSLPVHSEAQAVLRLLTRWRHFCDKQGGCLGGQDFLNFLPLLLLTPWSSWTTGHWKSVVRNLCAKAPRGLGGWAVGWTWQLRAMSGVDKFHHGFCPTTMMTTMTMTTFFF